MFFPAADSWGRPDGRTAVVRTGDNVWCPPGVKHWHGASPETAMSHLVLTNVKDGRNVTWMEPVSDEENARASADAVDPINK